MLFWILVAALASAVTFWVARPLLGTRASDGIAASAADVQVYKDQLAEIDADVARGTLNAAEAEVARAEVARRLLRSAESETGGPADKGAAAPLKTAHFALMAAVPVLSLALYLAYGSPNLPSLPHQDRLAAAPENATANDLIAKVEKRLREQPGDGKGWDVIAPVYSSQGRFAEAGEAYANAIKLLGESAKRLEGLAVADIRAANGVVTEKAKAALARALELEPKRIEPKLWLALSKEQDGNLAGAIADYNALIAEAPEGAPWKKALEDRLAGVEAQASGTQKDQTQAQPQTGAPPQGADSSVANLPAEQRQMIDGMVAGLAARLRADGNDLAGWLKLIKALKVLGREAEAKTAVEDARKAFAADTKAVAEIDAFAQSAGVAQ